MRSVLEQHGWRVVVQTYAELVQHFGIGPSGSESLIIDLFPGIRWGPVWLVEQPAASHDIDGFRVDPWVSFVKRVLLHVLVAPGPKFSVRPDRLELSDAERSAASIRLPRLVGSELAARLIATVQQQDVAGLEALRPHLRRSLVVSSVREAPLRALRTTVQWATMRMTFATTRRVMPTVSIVGPDGVDRIPVLAEVARQARERLRCPRVTVRQGRPGILPQLGGAVETPSRTPVVPARRTASRLGPIRTAYYALDFLLGHVLRDRRISVDLGLVVYEQGALDMYVDPVRYGLASGSMMRPLLRVLPQPDLIVLLYDEPDRIRERKLELEGAEIKRQLDLWMRFAATGAVHMVLPVDSDPPALAQRIVNVWWISSCAEIAMEANSVPACRMPVASVRRTRSFCLLMGLPLTLGVLGSIAACRSPSAPLTAEGRTLAAPAAAGPQAAITCPAGAINIPVGANIQSAVDGHRGDTVFCLKAGVHAIASAITPKTGNVFVGEFGAILDGTGWVTTDPNQAAFRAHNQDVDNVTVRNLVIRNMPQKGIHAFKDFSDNWTVEYCEITRCLTGIQMGNSSPVRHNLIRHNSVGGYSNYRGQNTTWESNEIAYNGSEQKIVEGARRQIPRQLGPPQRPGWHLVRHRLHRSAHRGQPRRGQWARRDILRDQCPRRDSQQHHPSQSWLWHLHLHVERHGDHQQHAGRQLPGYPVFSGLWNRGRWQDRLRPIQQPCP